MGCIQRGIRHKRKFLKGEIIFTETFSVDGRWILEGNATPESDQPSFGGDAPLFLATVSLVDKFRAKRTDYTLRGDPNKHAWACMNSTQGTGRTANVAPCLNGGSMGSGVKSQMPRP